MKPFKCQLLIIFFLFTSIVVSAQQSKEERKIAAVAEKLIGDIKYVEPGTYMILPNNLVDTSPTFFDGGIFYDSLGLSIIEENDYSLLMSICKDSSNGFYISKTEVTNKDYRQFVNWVRDSIAHTLMGHTITHPDGTVAIDWNKKLDWNPGSPLDVLFYNGDEKIGNKRNIDVRKLVYASKNRMPIRIYPDTLCWNRDFRYYFGPNVEKYWNHPVYDDYPVVGISWDQAMAYCEWKTEQINSILSKKGQPSIELRLPYEHEWEIACFSPIKDTNLLQKENLFPWDDSYYTTITDKKGSYRGNFGLIVDHSGMEIKNYGEQLMVKQKYDGLNYLYTSEVKSFGEYNGIYDMAGNVEEWTMDSPNFSKLNNIIFYWIESTLQGIYFKDTEEYFQKKDITNTEICSLVLKSIDDNDYLTFYKILNDLNFMNNESNQNKFYIEEEKIRVNKLFNRWWKEAQIIKQGNRKIAKGGSWASGISHLLIASARAYYKDRAYSFVGFRVAFSIDKKVK